MSQEEAHTTTSLNTTVERKLNNIMIKLKKIRRMNDLISCEAFLEDSTEPIHLLFNTITREIEPYVLPDGYEWCKSHVEHARRRLIEIAQTQENVSESLVMWY